MSKLIHSSQQRGSREIKSGERGNSMLEFGVVAPFLIILLFGTIALGIMLGRTIQVNSVCRDLAHMYVNGIDFTRQQSKDIAVQLGQGTGMTATGGNGVAIFSRVMTVYQADCDAAGFSGTCGNLGQCVITQRVIVGNASLRTSNFGTPNSALMNSAGNISNTVYLQNTDGSVRTSGLDTLLIAAGQPALIPQGNSVWITEVFYQAPDLSFLGTTTAGGSYARFIF